MASCSSIFRQPCSVVVISGVKAAEQMRLSQAGLVAAAGVRCCILAPLQSSSNLQAWLTLHLPLNILHHLTADVVCAVM